MQAVDLPRIISRNTGSNLVETPLCQRWPSTCAEMSEQGYNLGIYAPGTLVQAAEVGGHTMVAAADTLRIDSGACGVI